MEWDSLGPVRQVKILTWITIVKAALSNDVSRSRGLIYNKDKENISNTNNGKKTKELFDYSVDNGQEAILQLA